MPTIFHRTEFARSLVRRLLEPDVLDEALRSGVFLAGRRRTGKSTFLQFDLVPALEAAGAIVVYVDLWSAPSRPPDALVHEAIRDTLTELANPASRLLARLPVVAGANASAFGVEIGLDIERLGSADGPTLAKVLVELVDRSRTNVVLIVDEVQHALGSTGGNALLLALKAARDAVNLRPDTPGYLFFVGTGSHRALVGELTAQRDQAFAGAYATDYPLLGDEYVRFVLDRLARAASGTDGASPSPEASIEAFDTLGRRPEELLRAFEILRGTPDEGTPDGRLRAIAAALAASAADAELAKVERSGALAEAVFDRIVESDGDGTEPVRGLFGAASLEALGRRLGREVGADEISPVLQSLIAENLVVRLGYGRYGVSDPLVAELSRRRKASLAALGDD